MPLASGLNAFVKCIIIIHAITDAYSMNSEAIKPRLVPDVRELLIDEGESLEITCSSSRQIKLFYPQYDVFNRTKPSPHQIEFQDVQGPAMQWKFRRNKTIFGDTGWYGCADTAAEISSGHYHHPNATFVYVYVQSNASGFTEDIEGFTPSNLKKPIYVADYESEFIVPCRTTSPYLNVTLMHDKSNTTVQAENIVSYDPRIGFVVKNFIVNKPENLTCHATSSTDDPLDFHISYSVRKKNVSSHKKPEIVIFGEWMSQIYFDVNGDLIVMCKIQTANKVSWAVTLSTPTREVRGMHERKKLSENEVEVSCQYLLRDLTYESMGMYTCQFTGHGEVLTTEKYIHVHDNSSILMLQLHDYGADVVEHDNVSVICMANNVSASLSWLDAYMKPLLNTDRLNIVAVDDSNDADHLYNYLRLDIINVTKTNETIYVCKSVDESDTSHYRYYNLVVEEPETVGFTDINLNNTEIIIDDANPHEPILKCGAKGRPKPVVSWYQDGVQLKKDDDSPNVSKKQLDLPVQEREEHYQQFIDQEYLPRDDNNPQILSIKYLVLKVSTNYTCVAKNKFGEVKAYQIFSIPGKNDWAHPAIAFFIVIVAIVLCNYGFIKIRSRTVRRRCMREAGLLYFQNITDEELSPITMIYDQVDLLRYDKKWEFTRERLKLEKKLGSGAFGIVIKAKAYGINRHEAVTTVAVKMVRQYAETFQVRALASELKIMIYLGRHLNIVNLLGACTTNITKRELLVIVEYCPFGNLHDYLLTHRKQFIDQRDKKTGTIDFSIGQAVALDECVSCLSAESTEDTKNNDNSRNDSLCTQDLISWAFQVARGMEYLSQKNVLHGDLAARNILLTYNNVVKICDFGLAKVMEDDSYMKRSRGLLPIKWMAIESIRDRVFSVHSDVWSFGIVLWEFFTLAQVPYCDILPEVQLQKLLKGHRLEKPKYANDEIYTIMVPCWNEEPTLRPTFTMLVEQMGNLLQENVKTYYMDLSTLDESIKAIDSRYQNSYFTTARFNAQPSNY